MDNHGWDINQPMSPTKRTFPSTLPLIPPSKKYIDNFLSKYQTEIKLYNNAFYKDFSKVDKIFWKGIAPYIYDDKYLYKRAKFIRDKINNVNFDEFIFSKNKDKLTIKGFLNSTPIKIIPNCEKENDMKKEYWVYKNSTISWKNNCEKIIISGFNNISKKISLYNNPKLNLNYFPINLKSFKPFLLLCPVRFVSIMDTRKEG